MKGLILGGVIGFGGCFGWLQWQQLDAEQFSASVEQRLSSALKNIQIPEPPVTVVTSKQEDMVELNEGMVESGSSDKVSHSMTAMKAGNDHVCSDQPFPIWHKVWQPFASAYQAEGFANHLVASHPNLVTRVVDSEEGNHFSVQVQVFSHQQGQEAILAINTSLGIALEPLLACEKSDQAVRSEIAVR